MKLPYVIHPITALSFLFCEAAAWLLGGVPASLAIFLLNISLIAAICIRLRKSGPLKIIGYTTIYGVVLLSVIHGVATSLFAIAACHFHAEIAECPTAIAPGFLPIDEIASYFFRILIPLSAVSLVSLIVKLDQLSSQAIAWGIPLVLWRLVCQTFAQITELGQGAREAMVRHTLAGRQVQSISDRFSLLADLVTSIFYRGLLHSQEAHMSVTSRLRGNGRRVWPTTPMSFTALDFSMGALGVSIVLATLLEKRFS